MEEGERNTPAHQIGQGTCLRSPAGMADGDVSVQKSESDELVTHYFPK